ncbi:MAG: hypothetical protein O2798_08960 [Chloroflexi bacterium]|nr:hypothetical protein [Chloroflexota bacterium]
MSARAVTRLRPFALLIGLALLLGACRDDGGLTAEQDAAIRATIDPAAWALTLVLPDAETVEALVEVRPTAFHTLDYNEAGHLRVAAVAADGTHIAVFDLTLSEGNADRTTGATVLGRFSVVTAVEVGNLPEGVAGALTLAALVNAQRVIDFNYTPPATPDSLAVGLGLLDAFEAAGREWEAALLAGDSGHTPPRPRDLRGDAEV